MDNPAPRQRDTLWSVLGNLVYLSVTMFFLERALEGLVWHERLFHLLTMALFYLCIRRVSFLVIIFLNTELQRFLNALLRRL